MASAFSVVFIIILILFLIDIEIVNMEVTTISDTEIGERVKIYGTINSTTNVAIRGYYEGTGKNRDWIWEPGNFYIDDENGTIWVDASGLWHKEDFARIHSGLHENKEYWNGDKICVIGTAREHYPTGKALRAEYIGKDPNDFGRMSVSEMYFFGLFFGLSAFLSIVTGILLLRRRKIHVENFGVYSPKRYIWAREGMAEEEGVEKSEWTDFDYRQVFRSLAGVTILLVVILVLIIVFFVFLSSQNTAIQGILWVVILIFVILILIFALVLAATKRFIGGSSTTYKGHKKDIDIDKIEKRLKEVLDDAGLPYKVTKKEVFKGSFWRLIFDMREKGGKVAAYLSKGPEEFNFSVTLGPKNEMNAAFIEDMKGDIEEALDGYFDLDSL